MSLADLLNNRNTAIKTYNDALTSKRYDISEMGSDEAAPIIAELTALKKAAIEAATSYSEALEQNNASDTDKIQARDVLRNLSTAGGRRRRSSTPRKSSSSRRSRSAKRRTTSRKQQKRRRGSRRAH